MPVFTHHTPRGKIARAGQVWTDKLTFAKASAMRLVADFGELSGGRS